MSPSSGGGGIFNAGECCQDFRHDPAQEPVVELDAALLERLFEDVVHKRGVRLVAGFVAREGRDRRIQRLVVQQRKERGLEIAPSAKPGYSIAPTLTPDRTSGGVAR